MADDSVFSDIEALPWPQLTDPVYLLLMALGQRRFFTSDELKAKLDVATSGSSIDADGNLRTLVDSALRAIERAERKTLSEIPDIEISGYQQLLSSLLSQSTLASSANANVSGPELLKQLGALI